MGTRSVDTDRWVALRALTAFGHGGRLRLLRRGLDVTYGVETLDGRRFVLRVGSQMPIRSPAALRAEAAWIDALGRESDVAVPVVEWTKSGDLVSVVTDAAGLERGALLLERLQGRALGTRFGPSHAARLAAAQAELHRHSQRFALPPNAWLKAWDPALMCGRRIGDGRAFDGVAGAEGSAVLDAIESLLEAAVDELGVEGFGVINADVGSHNALWTGRRPAFYDFNDAGLGYFAFDLARYLAGLRLRTGGEVLVPAALGGYKDAREVPPGLMEYGALFEVSAGLFYARYLSTKVTERGPGTKDFVLRLVGKARQYLETAS